MKEDLLSKLYPVDGGIVETDLLTLRDAAFGARIAATADEMMETDPEYLITTFAGLVEDGVSLTTICNKIGIPRASLRKWLVLASEGIEPYATFALAIAGAEADLEINLVREFKSAPSQRSAQIMSFLERRFPTRWGKVASGQAEKREGARSGSVNIGSMNVLTIPSNGREAAQNILDVEFEGIE